MQIISSLVSMNTARFFTVSARLDRHVLFKHFEYAYVSLEVTDVLTHYHSLVKIKSLEGIVVTLWGISKVIVLQSLGDAIIG